ncbi:MAG: BREX system ATP-binding domain-containing protein [Nitrospirales bacterium]
MSQIFDALNRLQAIRGKEQPPSPPSPGLLEPLQDPSSPFSMDGKEPPILSWQKAEGSPFQVPIKDPQQNGQEVHGLSPEQWLGILQYDYLRSYVKRGGSAVKLAVSAGEGIHKSLQQSLSHMAKEEGFLFAQADARFTKLHMVDRLFHKIARQIEWDVLAYEFVSRLLTEKGYRVPANWEEFSLQQVASLNDRKEALLLRDLQAWIEQAIDGDMQMCREFRLAMISLCRAQLQAGESDLILAQAVKEWLQGELRLISGIKKALIFQKIVRHNGRYMLMSLTHWIRRVGKSGLVVCVDITRYLQAKRPAEPDTTFYYSPAAALDAYDMLRQFIDGTDESEGCLMVVVAPPAFLTDARRGLHRYEALKLRVWDDVRDKHHQNPLAPMVRLSAVEENQKLVPASPLSAGEEGADIDARRVIEGLRAGVPNRHVVQALGCCQPEVERQFCGILEATHKNARTGLPTRGMLVEGGFGTGKSHVLEYLQHLALDQHFICSRVVISKETPLYNPMRVYQAAIGSALMPNQTGQVLMELANEINVWSPEFQNLLKWAHEVRTGMDQRFAATLFLYQRMGTDPELRHRLVRFWSGEAISVGEIRSYLRECGVPRRYSFAKIREVDMTVQRFRFAAQLMLAAGYRGWILLIDEAELIGRYSLSQRVKSYAELARWLGALEASSIPGLAAVVALTNDFQAEILESKGDRYTVRGAAEEGGSTAGGEREAEYGIRLMEEETTPLKPYTPEKVEEAYQKIRLLHRKVHGCSEDDQELAEAAPPPILEGRRMREYVKSWITEWDLKRLALGDAVDIEVRPLKQEYREDTELESSTEEEAKSSTLETRSTENGRPPMAPNGTHPGENEDSVRKTLAAAAH